MRVEDKVVKVEDAGVDLDLSGSGVKVGSEEVK